MTKQQSAMEGNAAGALTIRKQDMDNKNDYCNKKQTTKEEARASVSSCCMQQSSVRGAAANVEE